MKAKLSYSEALDELTELVLASSSNTPMVLVDGRAGAGKSTFAKELQNKLFSQGDSLPRIIHLDDLYPGWDGLVAGVEYLNRMILTPLGKTGTASWQEFDWELDKRNTWREFSGGTPLIIEGCGAINSFTKQFALTSIYLEADEVTRKSRWLERDGERFMAYWEIWSAQELDFYAREKSKDLADYLLDTTVS
ncbi:MAG: ATP-binding protein [Microbacteriaceae bacterium]|nr:ATP-binding protein [Microbacteriaceae bacterium]